jgi:hypothetical protein
MAIQDPTFGEKPEYFVQRCLDALFLHKPTQKEWRADMIKALENLSEFYLETFCPCCTKAALHTNYYALIELVNRFHRDAYGVAELTHELNQKQESGELTARTVVWFKQEIEALGVRINSADPKLTRKAAAFSLWMATFRPFSLRFGHSDEVKDPESFSAALNFWITSTFLSRDGIGSIHLGGVQEKDKHLERVLHDFTYRDLTLSSLEFFYCGIFKAAQASRAA